MKKTKKRRSIFLILRILISLSILFTFFILFFLPAGISGERAFLHSFPGRSQFLPAILRAGSRASIGAGILAGSIYLFTFFFGRFYCSSLCPLGTVQDGINRISPWRNKRRYRSSKYFPIIFRLSFFTISIVLFFLGISFVLSFTEPFSVFSRMEKHLLKPLVLLVNSGAALLARIFGMYLEIEKNIAAASGILAAGVSFLILFFLSFFRGRLFCNTLCPAGTMLSFPARIARLRIVFHSDRCTSCGVCEGICKADCISSSQKMIDYENCILCFSCIDSCPAGALSYQPVKRPVTKQTGRSAGEPGRVQSRRTFLKNSVQGLFVLAAIFIVQRSVRFPKNAYGITGTGSVPVLPPGSGSAGSFYARCTACHVCISKCPQKVIRPGGIQFGIKGLEKPFLDYGTSFCEFECNVCSQICPAGAIPPISLKSKKRIKIGTASIDNMRCVVFKEGTACGACAEICPTTAVFMVPYTPGLPAPEVTPEVCIGCGACESACPVLGRKAITVTAEKIQGTAAVRKQLPGYAAEIQPGNSFSKGEEPPQDSGGFAF